MQSPSISVGFDDNDITIYVLYIIYNVHIYYIQLSYIIDSLSRFRTHKYHGLPA